MGRENEKGYKCSNLNLFPSNPANRSCRLRSVINSVVIMCVLVHYQGSLFVYQRYEKNACRTARHWQITTLLRTASTLAPFSPPRHGKDSHVNAKAKFSAPSAATGGVRRDRGGCHQDVGHLDVMVILCPLSEQGPTGGLPDPLSARF